MDSTDATAVGPARYKPDQLVVVGPHLRAVQGKLRDLEIRFGSEQNDDRLGLALLPLEDLDGQIARARPESWFAQHVAHGCDRCRPRPAGLRRSGLDLLLAALRCGFASGHGGWVPTIGKNRYLDPIHPWGPEIVGGGKSPWRPISGDTVRIARRPLPSRPVWVGILDTPLYAHEMLRGGYVADESSLLEYKPSLPPSAGHATFVAGLILQRAPEARLVVRGNLDYTGTAAAWETARAMMTFAGSGIDILNFSWGCRTEDGEPPLVLVHAVQRLSAEMVIVAAAGNHTGEGSGADRRIPTYPAALPDVVAVAATNRAGRPARFNLDGPWVNLLAHGVKVDSTYLDGEFVRETPGGPVTTTFNGFARGSGTSFAAANVTGEIAAKTQPGERGAREVLQAMLSQRPNESRFTARPAQADD
jgi:hypothetical protein